VERPTVSSGEPLRNELDSFVTAVMTNSTPKVSIDDGIRALELAQKIDSIARERPEVAKMSNSSDETVHQLYGSSLSTDVKRDSFTLGAVPVAVYGLGKMGLPLAGIYAETCGNVTGVDIDSSVVDRVNAGDCPITGEPGLPKLIEQTVDDGQLHATTDISEAATDASIHVAIVPTLLSEDQKPDLSILKPLLRDIGNNIHPEISCSSSQQFLQVRVVRFWHRCSKQRVGSLSASSD